MNKKAIIKFLLAKKFLLTFSSISVIVIAILTIMIFIFMMVIIFAGGNEDEGVGVSSCSANIEIDEKDKKSIIGTFEKYAKGGVLEGKGNYIVDQAIKYDITPSLAFAILASESGWGKTRGATVNYNPFSLMPNNTLIKFPTIEKGLEAGLKNLNELYIKQGLTTAETIGPKYAPIGASNDPTGLNNNWVKNVKAIQKLLGDNATKGNCNSVTEDFKGDIPKWDNKPEEGNKYTPGQCTWFVYSIRKKMGKPISTYWYDAHYWNERAEADGYKVGNKPKVGAVFVAEQGAGGHATSTGHVAIVTGVNSDGSFNIYEMNWKGPYIASTRENLKMTSGYSFIY